MNKPAPPGSSSNSTGLRRFVLEVARQAAGAPAGRQGKIRFIRGMGERYAYIRPGDMGHPLRFLRQMAGAPPIQLGVDGFRPDILDDYNPARHYTAFVWTGFWLPVPLAIAVLYLWEAASFVRYRGAWSQKDILSGYIGVRHGTAVRRQDCTVLPRLIATELADPEQVDVEELLAEVNAVLAAG